MLTRWKLFYAASLLAAALLWWAPAYSADWAFAPSVSLQGYYDSNIFFRARDAESDFVTTVNPVFTVMRDTGTSHLEWDAAATAQKYLDQTSLDDFFYNTRALYSQDVTERLKGEFSGTAGRDSTLESQLNEAGLMARNVPRCRFDVGARETYALTERWSLSASESGAAFLYPDGNYPDSVSWKTGVEPSYLLGPRDTVGMNLMYVSTGYKDVSAVQTLQDVAYWKRALSETASLNIGVGFRETWMEFYKKGLELTPGGFRITRGEQRDAMPGIIFNLVLAKDWSNWFSTSFSAGKEQYNSAEAISYDRTYAGVTLRYGFSELTALSLDLRYDHNTEVGDGDNVTDYVRVVPYIERKLTADISIRFAGLYEQERQEIGPYDSNAERFKTWLQLSYTWPKFLSSK